MSKISDPELYTTGKESLLPTWAECRKRGVFWVEPGQREGFWLASRHRDVTSLFRTPHLLSAENGMTLDTVGSRRDPSAGCMLEVSDPPAHGRIRRALSPVFNPHAVEALSDTVHDVVVETFDSVPLNTRVDAVQCLSAVVPMRVMARLVGFPEEDIPWLRRRVDCLFGSPGGAGTAGGRGAALTAAIASSELLQYIRSLIGSSDCMLSKGLRSLSGVGGVWGDRYELLNIFNVLVGGSLSTRHTLSASLHALAVQRNAWSQLVSGRRDVDLAVEELARWASPARHVARTVKRTFRYEEQELQAGDAVILNIAAANQDETVFRAPERLDLGRRPNPHLAFSVGVHSCVGAGLARLEIRTVLNEIGRRFDWLALAGKPKYFRSTFLDGYTALPMMFVPKDGVRSDAG